MSSGLGDYIHYHADNYKKYGIGKNSTAGMSFGQACSAAHNELRAMLGEQNLAAENLKYQELAQVLNYLSSGTPISADESFQAIQRYLDESRKEIQYAMEVFQPGAVLTAGGKAFTGTSSVQKPTASTSSGKKQIAVLKREGANIKNMMNSLMLMLNSGKISAATAANLWSRLKTVKENIGIAIASAGGAGDSQFFIPAAGTNGINSFLDDARQIYNDYFKSSQTQAEGIGAEITVGALSLGAQQAVKQPKSAMENLLKLTGSHRSVRKSALISAEMANVKVLEKQINTNKDGQYRQTWRFDHTNGTFVTVKGYQDTVDVILDGSAMAADVADFVGLAGTLNASVKNYSTSTILKHGISVISSTSLWSIFALVNTDFSNHYLNMLSVTGVGEGQREGFGLSEASKVIKEAIAIRGLLGVTESGFSGKKVDVFIVNGGDYTTPDWRVFSTYNLLLDLFGSNMSGLDLEEDLPYNFENEWVGRMNHQDAFKANLRIANVLAQAHATKISAHLRGDILGFI